MIEQNFEHLKIKNPYNDVLFRSLSAAFNNGAESQFEVMLPVLEALYKALEEVTQAYHDENRHKSWPRDCFKRPCIDADMALALAEDKVQE